jgi:hypothetical protein
LPWLSNVVLAVVVSLYVVPGAIMVETAEVAGSFEEFEIALEQALADPDLNEVVVAGGAAALQLDQYTIPECGFKLSK